MSSSVEDMASIQKDNAGLHTKDNDQSSILDQGHWNRWNIEMKSQPSNSPDFNILDSGLFNSIQSLPQSMPARTIEELVPSVEKAFKKLPSSSINKTFLPSLGKVLGWAGKTEVEILSQLVLMNNVLLPTWVYSITHVMQTHAVLLEAR